MDADRENEGDFDATAFEALERDFQEILQELVGDKSLEHFRQEYDKLHRALKKSHESEKHLIKKCRDLNTEIVQNAVKVQTALKLSQEDQTTISALKKEIERAWKMVEMSHEKEQRARGTIQDLKSEITKLGQLVEQGAGLSINQENMVNQLVQEKNDLIKLRDMLQLQVMQSEQQHADLIARVQKLEAERHTGGIELADLKEQLAQRLLDAEMEQKRKEQLDKDVKEMRCSMDTRQSEIDAKKSEMNQNAEVISQLEVQLRAEKQSIESLKANRARLENSREAYKKTNKEDLVACEKLSEEQAELQAQLKCKHDEISTLKSQKQKLSSRLEALKKKKGHR